MFDLLHEIFSTLQKNKLRTFLTGFSMAWGIFMLIVLLGAGTGLQNGILFNFGESAHNVITLWPGTTSVAHEGLQRGRRIRLDGSDEKYLKDEFSPITSYTPILNKWERTLTWGQHYTKSNIRGVRPEYAAIEGIKTILQGRFLNELDQTQERKVIVLHERTAEQLFKTAPAVGKFITADKVVYQVIGVYTNSDRDRNPPAFIPFGTAQNIYNKKNDFSSVTFQIEGLDNKKELEVFENDMRAAMARKHQYKADDRSALYIWNQWEDYLQTMGIFHAISAFIWLIGIGTLVAGVVGISNIMLITVKERTKEIGIRKSLGAKPASIIRLILTECLLITGIFGYIGMLAGIVAVEIMNMVAGAPAASMDMENLVFFTNPNVNIKIVALATLVLMAAGLCAGYVPAKKAIKVKPVEALRYE